MPRKVNRYVLFARSALKKCGDRGFARAL